MPSLLRAKIASLVPRENMMAGPMRRYQEMLRGEDATEAMTARDKFAIGDAIVLSEYGRETFPLSARLRRWRQSRVVGFSRRERKRVVIRIDGSKCRATWHMDFWEHGIEPPR